MFKLKQSFILINIAFLAACSSNGGSFDVDSVKQNTEKKAEYKPKYADDDSAPRRKVTDAEANALTQPGLGFETKIPYRNGYPVNRLNPTPAPAVYINEKDIVQINGPLSTLPHEAELRDKLNEDNRIVHSADKEKLDRQNNYNFVRAGFVAHQEPISTRLNHSERVHYEYHHGYLYYLGEKPATALPEKTATYRGHWAYVTNAQHNPERLAGKSNDTDPLIKKDKGNAGSHYGATNLSLENINNENPNGKIGHSTEINVNFSDKTLTGKLSSNGVVVRNQPQEIKERYTIEAKLNGNRFTGKAISSDKNSAYFGAYSNTLEGGFFGPNAQELAGKFLADDKSIFVVFAGKRDSKEGDAEQAFDAVKVRLSDLSKTDLDTFGRATHLVIGGRQVPLLADGKSSFSEMAFDDVITRNIGGKNYKITVCCNNLDYVKFGTYEEEGSRDGYQYLVGERTAVKDLPSGKAHYRGTWNGVISSKDGKRGGDSPSNKDGGTRALFDVDFGDKSIKGKLIANNGVDDRPMLSLDGKIQGNGFTGTAKTGADGFNIDPGSTAGGTVVHLNAPFSGGFYGKNAAELGGVVHSAEANQDKVSITFGGKRQVEQ
ncbi:transferrin-binding protein [Mannheimia granulomatis]|nr:transferrin-binding protein [Mannheimia granulomatis]